MSNDISLNSTIHSISHTQKSRINVFIVNDFHFSTDDVNIIPWKECQLQHKDLYGEEFELVKDV